MPVVLPSLPFTITGLATSKAQPSMPFVGWSNARLPTDALFNSDLTLENIVVGSAYWIALQADLSTVITSGTAATTTVVISNQPVYTNPQLLELRVRKSTSGTRYVPLKVYAFQDRDGASFYVAQVEDPT